MELIKGTDEKGARARENRRATQGRAVWVSPPESRLNKCRVDIGATLADGTTVFLEDVPFNPQSPPSAGDWIPLEYEGSSPHSVRAGIGRVSGETGQGSLQIVASNVVNSVKVSGETLGQAGNLTLAADGTIILITRAGKVFTFSSPEMTAARDSAALATTYASLDARLEAIEAAIVACGCIPGSGLGPWMLDFSKQANSMYVPVAM